MNKNITNPKFDGTVIYFLFWAYIFFQVLPVANLILLSRK